MDLESQRPRLQPVDRGIPWGPVLLVVCAVAVYLVLNRPVPIPEGWLTDFTAAMAEARATDRRVLAAFALRGCAPCAAMDRSVLPSAPVRAALEEYVPVHVDLATERGLADRYGVFAAPTYAVIDSHGRLIARRDGYVPVDAFVEFLRSASKMTLEGPARTPERPRDGA